MAKDKTIADHFAEMERRIAAAKPADLALTPSQIGNGREDDA